MHYEAFASFLKYCEFLTFSDVSETKTDVVIIPFPFIRRDEGL